MTFNKVKLLQKLIIIALLLQSCDNKKSRLETILVSKLDSTLATNQLLPKTREELLFELASKHSTFTNKDSAFYYIDSIMASDSSRNIFSNPTFYHLLNEAKWKDLEIKQYRKTKKYYPFLKDSGLVLKIWRLYLKDQAYYDDIFELQGKGYNQTIDSLWRLKKSIGLNNLNELEVILSKFKWLKISEFGTLGSETAFLIVQHSDISYQKKYIDIIEAYCKQNEASWNDYCLMKDRILVAEGKKQIYGTQLYSNDNINFKLNDVEMPEYLNKRRFEKGLSPIDEYLKTWGLKFNVVQK